MTWTILTLDEYEALRLVDADGMDQEEAAVAMGVSRPTVSRIMADARRKLASALVAGHGILIEGGVTCPRGEAGIGEHGRHRGIGRHPHGACRGQGRGKGPWQRILLDGDGASPPPAASSSPDPDTEAPDEG